MVSAVPLRHVVFACFFPLCATLHGAGLVRDGSTARTQAMGGAATATAQSPLEALVSNPAALGDLPRLSIEVSSSGTYLRGRFDRAGEKTSHLQNRLNFLAEGAVVFPTKSRAISWGISAAPSFAGDAEWRYRDVEGGLGGTTTYGVQEQHGRFLVYNLQAGIGAAFSSWFSAGASFGVLYNYNSLRAPYTFQSEKTLRGFKTNLDLETEGFGVGGMLGITLKLRPDLKLSATYVPPAEVRADGTADADLSAQLDALGPGFAGVPRTLKADAEVLAKLPQKVSAALAWQPTPKFLLSAQWDWVNWSDAFDDLTIHLSNSSNAPVNGLVGANEFTDFVPLRWNNQTILRMGGEYSFTENWKVRGGYAHSTQAVPRETLTPHLAALSEHQVSAGIGYETPGWHVDLAAQWDLPSGRSVDRSILQSGEYSQSTITVESYWLGLTYGLQF